MISMVNITNPTAPTEVTSIPLPNTYGWGFDVLNERYVIVAEPTLFITSSSLGNR